MPASDAVIYTTFHQYRPRGRRQMDDIHVPKCSFLLVLLADGLVVLVHQALGAHDLERVVEGVQLRLRGLVRAKLRVGPCEVLAVVAGEVDVVQRVVRRAVDVLLEPVACDHVAVVDEDGPDLHGEEEHHV